MDVLFSLSQENLPLALAEIEELFCVRVSPASPDTPGLVCARIAEADAALLSRLALTRFAGELLLTCPLAQLASALAEHGSAFAACAGTFCAKAHSIPGLTDAQLGASLWSLLPNPQVDVRAPDHVFDAFPLDNNQGASIALCHRLSTNPGNYMARRGHLRPVLHPSTMHPKFARALVNLSGARREILDPMCGTGGILIEAGLVGLHCIGCDLDERLLAGARANLEGFGVRDFTLSACDVRELARAVPTAEAVVTDFPYGKHSRAPKDIERFYRDALMQFAQVTARAVIVLPHWVDATSIVAKTPWRVVRSCAWYAHKSLTRVAYILDATHAAP